MSEFQRGDVERGMVQEELMDTKSVDEFYTVANPILGVDWEGHTPEAYTSDYAIAQPEKTKIFVFRDPDSHEIVAGGKAAIIEESEVEDYFRLPPHFLNKKGVVFEYGFVKQDVRGKDLHRELLKKRNEWASTVGADYVCVELSTENPRAINVQLRDRDNPFILISVFPPGHGMPNNYLVGVRPVEYTDEAKWRELQLPIPSDLAPATEASIKKYEWREVPLNSSIEELDGLFKEGWVGVDIKYDVDSSQENISSGYLIFERTK